MKKFKFPIDLSMLTEEEINQFREDPSTLFQGDTDVCLYLRFSSERQKEQSIEGQLRDCIAYCKRKNYRIVAIYVDRATTARKDVEKRVHFQEMITASVHQTWKLVIVWKLDRFARNREDSAVFKMRLRKNGVKVESATEGISKNPEGIILEAVLEGIAEYYSADLSQKITRGMRESALKCHSIGGHVPLGYKIEDHKLVINPDTAHIVQEAFELYANGETVADICRMFNAKGYRTAKGAEFNRNSFKSMFRNRRYIGVYRYKDFEKEGGVPPIIDKDLFETVQKRLSANAEAPARGKAKVDYLLAGKLFCGHCGGSMNGESGTSKTGAVHNYYACYTRKRQHSCDKKPLRKEWIEQIVAQDAMELLTDDAIQEMADMAISQTEKDLRENTRIPELSERMKETESGIANITKAVEKGIASDALMSRLVELEKEKKNLLRLIAEEEKYVCKIDRDQIVYWLTKFKDGNIEDENFKRIIIDLMVNSVTVWDEPDGFRITTAYNLTSCENKTFRIPSSSDKGFGFEGLESTKRNGHDVSSCPFLLAVELFLNPPSSQNSGPGCHTRDRCCLKLILHVEAEVDHVAVLHHILLAFAAELALLLGGVDTAVLDHIIIGNDLRPDEAPLDVSVDFTGGLRGLGALFDGPGAALILAVGQERDKAQQGVAALDEPIQTGFCDAQLVQEHLPVLALQLSDVLLQLGTDGQHLAALGFCQRTDLLQILVALLIGKAVLVHVGGVDDGLQG